MAFDHPGTGETTAPLDAFADEVIAGLISQARQAGNGRVAHFGLSFGGNFPALSGLSGLSGAAIGLGGPVEASFGPENLQRLMFGLAGIGGNADGFTAPPTPAQQIDAARPFIRRALLDQHANAPMLVINGADDVHVVQADTLVFQGRPDTEVHLIPGTGHVAASKLPEVMPVIISWLRARLAA